jgi:hypothetical protein
LFRHQLRQRRTVVGPICSLFFSSFTPGNATAASRTHTQHRQALSKLCTPRQNRQTLPPRRTSAAAAAARSQRHPESCGTTPTPTVGCRVGGAVPHSVGAAVGLCGRYPVVAWALVVITCDVWSSRRCQQHTYTTSYTTDRRVGRRGRVRSGRLGPVHAGAAEAPGGHQQRWVPGLGGASHCRAGTAAARTLAGAMGARVSWLSGGCDLLPWWRCVAL